MVDETPSSGLEQARQERIRGANRQINQEVERWGRGSFREGYSYQDGIRRILFNRAGSIASSNQIHPDFREDLKYYQTGFGMSDFEFTAHDGSAWRFTGRLKDVLHVKRVSHGRGSELEILRQLTRQDDPILEYREGKVAAGDENQNPLNAQIEPDGVINNHLVIGGYCIVLLEDLEEALTHPPQKRLEEALPSSVLREIEESTVTFPKPRDLQAEERQRQHEEFRREMEERKPMRRQYPNGELDERFYNMPRFSDILAVLSGVDRENPQTRLSSISDESHAWTTWQMQTPFIDESGNTQTCQPGGIYYYTSRDEHGRIVRLEARWGDTATITGKSDAVKSDDVLRIRELRETPDGQLEDLGEVGIKSWYRGRYAEYWDPKVDSNNEEPTIAFDHKGGSIIPLRRAERSYTMLADGKLVGYKSPTGDFVPAHRSAPPKS